MSHKYALEYSAGKRENTEQEKGCFSLLKFAGVINYSTFNYSKKAPVGGFFAVRSLPIFVVCSSIYSLQRQRILSQTPTPRMG